MVKKHVIIIGGGITGCCSAHDLTLRGFDVTVIERGNIACCTTGRCSCDQHSGARYAVKDKESAVECIEENKIVRQIMAPGAIVENDGVFVLLGEDDPEYGDQFFDGCRDCGILVKEIQPKEFLAREPNMTRDIRRVAVVPDAIVEPYRYTLSYAATAKSNGARFLLFTEAKEILMAGNDVIGVRVYDRCTNKVFDIRGDLVLNAAGPWVNKISALAGINIPLSLSPGIHVVIGVRLTHMAINRMHLPGSGDWIAPVRNHSVLGTSSWTIQDCDYIMPRQDHIQQMRDEVGVMVPLAKTYPVMAVNAAARPLLATSGKSERDLSRTFECIDHAVRDRIEGFVTIAGGKLSVARVMAEKASNLICKKNGNETPCQTRTYPLLSYRHFYLE